MKRSTPNNFSNLIKGEIVKRFESVVKEEIRQYKSTVSKTNDDILDLRKQIEALTQRQKQVEIDNHKVNLENKSIIEKCFDKFSQNLDVKFRELCLENKKLLDNQRKFDSVAKNYITYEIFYKFRDEILKNFQIFKDEVAQEIATSDLLIHNFNAENDFKSSQHKEDVEWMIKSLSDELSKLCKLFAEYKVDSEGIIRMMRVDQKSIFILEKNIQNIYTQIKRLKGGS